MPGKMPSVLSSKENVGDLRPRNFTPRAMPVTASLWVIHVRFEMSR